MAQRMVRHTGTYDAELLGEIRAEVGPRGVSAFLNEAARERLAGIRLRRLLDEMDETRGPVPAELMAEVADDAERIFGP